MLIWFVHAFLQESIVIWNVMNQPSSGILEKLSNLWESGKNCRKYKQNVQKKASKAVQFFPSCRVSMLITATNTKVLGKNQILDSVLVKFLIGLLSYGPVPTLQFCNLTDRLFFSVSPNIRHTASRISYHIFEPD